MVKEVGRVGVRAIPLTDDFNRKLEALLKKAERAAKIEVKIDFDESRLDSLLSKLAKIKDVEVNVDLDTESMKRAEEQLEDLTEDLEADVFVDPDTSWASARLAWLARARTAEIIPLVNAKAAAIAETVLNTLGRFSGARVLDDWITGFKDMVLNLDKATPKLMMLGTGLGSLVAATGALASNLFTIGADLVKILPIVNVLPGLMAGFATGGIIMMQAFKDIGTVLADLGPRFTQLQDSLSSKFWAQAEEPIRRLANDHFPAFARGVNEVAHELGIFMASFTNSLNTSLGGGVLERMFGNLRESIDIASTGIQWMVDGIVRLGDIGGSYLPRMATWFNDIAESFSNWTKTADITGMIDTAIFMAQELGRVLAGISGVFSAIATAAERAGGAGLTGMANGLERVREVMESPAFQDGLVSFFESSHEAMDAIGQGVANLANSFGEFLPTLNEVMIIAGDAAETLLTAFGTILENPVFQGGLVRAFEGIRTGMEGLATAADPIAEVFGTLFEVFGTLAETIGPLLGDVLSLLAPVFIDILEAVEPLIPIFGELLLGAIEALVPIIAPIVEAISDWVQQNPDWAAGLIIAGAALWGIVTAVIGFITTVAPMIAAIAAFVGTVGGVPIAIGALIAVVVAAIIGLAAVIILNWDKIVAWTTDTWNTIVTFLGEAWANITQFFSDSLANISSWWNETWGSISTFFMDVWNGIVEFFVGVWETITETFTTAVEGITEGWNNLWSGIGQFFTDTWNGISEFFVTKWEEITTFLTDGMTLISEGWALAWEGISTTFQAVWQAIYDYLFYIFEPMILLIQDGVTAIAEWWGPRWEDIKLIFTTVWDNILAFIGGVLESIVAIFHTVVDPIVVWWQTTWASVSSFFQTTWAAISAFVVGKVNEVRNTITSVIGAVKDWWDQTWTAIGNFIRPIWDAISTFVRGKIQEVRTNISNTLTSIKSTWDSIWNAVSSVAQAVWSVIVSTVTSRINAVRNTISSAMSSIQSWWSSAWSSIAAFLSTAWSRITQAVSTGINTVVNFFRTLVGRVVGALQALPGRLAAIGRNMMQSLANAIRNAGGAVLNAIGGAVDGAINKAKSLLGINSPSRVFMAIGEGVDEGFAKGIDDKVKLVQDSVHNMGEVAIREAEKFQKTYAGVLSRNVSMGDIETPLAMPVAAGISTFNSRAMVDTSPIEGSRGSSGNTYYDVRIDAKDLEGLKTVEEMTKTFRLRSRLISGEDEEL